MTGMNTTLVPSEALKVKAVHVVALRLGVSPWYSLSPAVLLKE